MHPPASLCSALLVAALTSACGDNSPPAPTKISTQRAEREAGPLSAPAASNPSGVPKITADEAVHDFGSITATATAEHVFAIRNAGDADLKIQRVQKT